MKTGKIAKTPTAGHQRKLTHFSDVMRFLRQNGVSPRPSTTLYYDANVENTRDDLPDFDNPAQLLLKADSSFRKIVAVSSASTFSIREEIEELMSGNQPSPSYAVSPHAETDTEPDVESVPDAASLPDVESLPDAFVTVPEATFCLQTAGYKAFNEVILDDTGDRLTFAVSPLGDRCAIYSTDELRAESGKVPEEKTEVIVIKTPQEAEENGAYALGRTAGVCAAEIEVASSKLVFGVCAATKSPSNLAAARYFALLCKKSDSEEQYRPDSPGSASDASGGRSPSTNKKAPPGDQDMFIFAQTRAAAQELRLGKSEAVFNCAYAVLPVVHLEGIKDDCLTGKADIAEAIRKATPVIERTFVSNMSQRMIDSLEARTKRINGEASRMRELFMDANTAKTKETQMSVVDFAATQSSISGYRLAEMAAYSSKIQETLGTAWTRVEILLSEAEDVMAKALASAFVETRLTIAPETKSSKYPFVHAVKWGYGREIDACPFGSGAGTRPILDVAQKPSTPPFLQEFLLRAHSRISS